MATSCQHWYQFSSLQYVEPVGLAQLFAPNRIMSSGTGNSSNMCLADLLMAIAVKLPSFWPDNIETWLIQLESQFCLRGVVCSQTKFDCVVQAMSQSDTVKVLDLIRAPLVDVYKHIQKRLLKFYALTNYEGYEAVKWQYRTS